MPFFIIISVAILVGRYFIVGRPPSIAGSFEAFAHIWVGVLLCILFSKVKVATYWIPVFVDKARIISFISLIILSLFELGMFFRDNRQLFQ